MVKLTILLIVLLGVQPQALDIQITPIALDDIIKDNKTYITAFGVGEDSNEEKAGMKARQSALAMLTGIMYGYEFEYQQQRDSYMVRNRTMGEVDNVETRKEIVVSDDPFLVFLTLSREGVVLDLDNNDAFAFVATITVQSIVRLNMIMARMMGQTIQEFATMNDVLWAKGKAYMHDITIEKNGDDEYKVSYKMILVPEAE